MQEEEEEVRIMRKAEVDFEASKWLLKVPWPMDALLQINEYLFV